jgi:hypothetical protein
MHSEENSNSAFAKYIWNKSTYFPTGYLCTYVASELTAKFVFKFQNIISLQFCAIKGKSFALGGVVVSVLATGPKVSGFKPG